MVYNKDNPLRVMTLCSGYDSQCMALNRVKTLFPDFDYDLVAWCEIDPYAVQAHNAVFPQYADRNLGDLTKIDWDNAPACDLITWSTPCQSISSAGLQHGLAEGSGTRSSLAFNAVKAITTLKPRYALMENVKALVSKKFMPDFKRLQDYLSEAGYTNYWKVVNATQCGVPQNRERVFMVSILGDHQPYRFPDPEPLTRCLGDVLDDDVDESYFLSQDKVDRVIAHCERKLAEGCGFSTNFTPPQRDKRNDQDPRG